MKNRGIKFGAWDGQYMRQDVCIEPNGIVSWIIDGYDGAREIDRFVDGVDELIIMQFTGLKDKNGKEIYEGDVVRMIYKEDEGGGWYSKTPIERGIVYFDPFWGVKFDCRNNTQRISEHWKNIRLRTMQDVEVIGNIHQNPELL